MNYSNKINKVDRELLVELFITQQDILSEPNGDISINDSDFQFDFTGVKQMIPPGFQVSQFNYINNPDGTIRWIYPKRAKRPTFLEFYSASSWKANAFVMITKAAFRLGLRRFIQAGTFSISHKHPLRIESIGSGISFDNYSLFTGTVGPNRKVLMELNLKGKTTHFVKIPLKKNNSSGLVENEMNVITRWRKHKLLNLEVPVTQYHPHEGSLAISSIKPDNSKRETTFTNRHAMALEEMYKESTEIKLSESSYWDAIQHQLQQLKHDDRIPEHSEIAEQLRKLASTFDPDMSLKTSLAHMDFTPWNMYVNSKKLFVYDWELSRPGVPLLFDLFHFIYSSEILIGRKSFKEIRSMINDQLQQAQIQSTIKANDLDIDRYHDLYLLFNCSYYLNIYQQQESLHQQVFWLAGVWNGALKNSLSRFDSKTNRTLFLNDFANTINLIPHAMLKSMGKSIHDLSESSDVDLLIEKKRLPELMTFIQRYPLIQHMNVVRKSFMTIVQLFFNDGSFLSLDLLHELRRKSLRLPFEESYLQNAKQDQIKIPEAVDDIEYILLFYLLNRADVPKKYAYIINLSEKFQTNTLHLFNEKYGMNLHSFDQLLVYSPEIRDQLTNAIGQFQENSFLNRFVSYFNYLKDTLMQGFHGRGFVITFSGVDGAGKSTIIEGIKEQISIRYRRNVVVLRHRPSILPILSAYKYGKDEAEKRSVASLPRQGGNHSTFSSLLRFSYYYSDYLLGQVWVYLRYLALGNIVIYDRYYYDFINDSLRSNLHVSPTLVKHLFRFIHKPRLNFFLYAPSDVILARKKELSSSDIHLLTDRFKQVFTEFSKKYTTSRYILIKNIDKQQTLTSILDHYHQVA